MIIVKALQGNAGPQGHQGPASNQIWEFLMMSSQFGKNTAWVAAMAALIVGSFANSAWAQFGGGVIQQIGGVWVNQARVLDAAPSIMVQDTREKLLQLAQEVDPQLKSKTSMRVISLRSIENALRECVENGTELPDEIKYLAGIQRIQNVIAVPERNDVLLCGPGEGWIVDEAGNIVGETTRRPVIHLEDLIVALRTAEAANRDQGITVSIGPTPEGMKRYNEVSREISRAQRGFGEDLKPVLEEAMGLQDITLTGLPKDSRMAQILVVADYHMKRIAMGHEPAAVEGLPSVLEIAESRGSIPATSPRFWLEPSYDSVTRSEDGLVWQIAGPGAKAMTENEILVTDGSTKKVKDHPVLTKWAENMTERFAALADADPVFAELQNVMDLAVVAAIIEKQSLCENVKLEIPMIAEENNKVKLPERPVPASVASQCSFTQVRGKWMVTTAGGVQVDSWGVLEIVQVDNSLASLPSRALANVGDKAWWNAVN
jgi:Protein of unknown function (DUF1598)